MLKKSDAAIEVFRKHQGILRAQEAKSLGIYGKMLSRLNEQGRITKIARGVYCLADLKPLANHDLVILHQCVPQGIICLISALQFHQLTTHNPQTVSVAIQRGDNKTKIDWPPTQFYFFGREAYLAGIETYQLDSFPIRIYGPEKTLVDCFKFRHKLGMDLVLEALKTYRSRFPIQTEKIIHFAELCRVKRIMLPYLESML